ncbi:MAG: hypothetical protein SGJ18_02530 [Pseudomonadota bacterium]|nr:hypothetical protein [Pseudomonadota bacterium]
MNNKSLFRASLPWSLLGVILIVLGFFQNCSKVNFAKNDVQSTSSILSVPKISIEGGSPFTKKLNVTIDISASSYSEMFLTNDPDCAGEPIWSPVKSSEDWILLNAEQSNSVFAIFKSDDGRVSLCTSAGILHDSIAPVGDFTVSPKAFLNVQSASLEYYAEDLGSGLDKLECKLNAGPIDTCSSVSQLLFLPEGVNTLYYRALDRAKNYSEFEVASWWVDLTDPTVAITKAPLPMINKSNTEIVSSSSDGNGSGIDRHVCLVDNIKYDPCLPTYIATNLSEGNHVYQVVAIDKAGNVSAPVEAKWLVDTVPSDAFDILGVRGDNENKIDNYLGTSPNPNIYWTVSLGAAKYQVSVLDSNKVEVCPVVEVIALTQYKYMPAQCSLMDTKYYFARVIAIDQVNNSRTVDFLFRVDLTPPAYLINPPIITYINNAGIVNLSFTVSDLVSGVENATCYRVLGTNILEYPCKGLSQLTLTNLVKGAYKFYIQAIDIAGNTSQSTPLDFTVLPIVCDPFTIGMDKNCKTGIKANLYYIPAGVTPPTTVDGYIAKGTLVDVLIYFSKLFVPTRSFTDGFATTDNSVIKNGKGETLFEYFALDMQTILKLGPNDLPGNYQLALLSDDGSILSIKPNGQIVPKIIVNNDGDHPTKLGCANEALAFDATTRIPTQIKYYQGPRTHIALSVMWRPIAAGTSLADPLCGVAGNDTYFGADYKNFTTAGYAQLLQRGWRVLTPENYILDEKQ